MGSFVVVDDSMLSRIHLVEILKELQYNVIAEATNGEEGYEMYVKHQPDIITMDINMPTLDGISAVKKIRKDFPKARIIMVSAHDEREVVLEAIKEGAKDFIAKPFDIENIKNKLQRALGR